MQGEIILWKIQVLLFHLLWKEEARQSETAQKLMRWQRREELACAPLDSNSILTWSSTSGEQFIRCTERIPDLTPGAVSS